MGGFGDVVGTPAEVAGVYGTLLALLLGLVVGFPRWFPRLVHGGAARNTARRRAAFQPALLAAWLAFVAVSGVPLFTSLGRQQAYFDAAGGAFAMRGLNDKDGHWASRYLQVLIAGYSGLHPRAVAAARRDLRGTLFFFRSTSGAACARPPQLRPGSSFLRRGSAMS